MIIDRKTKKEVQVGDSLIRRTHFGYKTRYEVLEIREDKDEVFVRKLAPDDRWIYLHMPIAALQLIKT